MLVCRYIVINDIRKRIRTIVVQKLFLPRPDARSFQKVPKLNSRTENNDTSLVVATAFFTSTTKMGKRKRNNQQASAAIQIGRAHV